jgi:hypothetical protein
MGWRTTNLLVAIIWVRWWIFWDKAGQECSSIVYNLSIKMDKVNKAINR